MRDLAFLMNMNATVMMRKRMEKFPRNALISPKKVCVNGAIYRFKKDAVSM